MLDKSFGSIAYLHVIKEGIVSDFWSHIVRLMAQLMIDSVIGDKDH